MTEEDVAGIDKECAIDDYGSSGVERAAHAGDVVYGLVGLACVVIPKEFAVGYGASAEVAVERTGEDGGRLCGTAGRIDDAGELGGRWAWF